ncbi:hypothetical protein GCM10009795_096480 [Nocardioides hankookensis]|uniref:Helix-turn-helix domain-containing protein n=1 Tax=Nocardioides hankookensis TaxID=443157 RepID=A0ABW1LLJ6_9ACTN
MVMWRSPALEAVLGASLDEAGLTEEVIQRLVEVSAAEGEQLDFKLKAHLPETGPVPVPSTGKGFGAEQEFAKDVCAFANHMGGLLLIGIKDAADVAVEATPTVTDPVALEQRLRRAVLNYASPVPQFQCIPIPAAAGGHYMAIIVPPSPAAPHAVRGAPGNDQRPLHYPVRDGSTTRYLLEHEVADRYRLRAAGHSERAALRTATVAEGLHALERADDDIWLYLALVPESPSLQRLDRSTVDAMKNWLREYGFTSPLERTLHFQGVATPAPERLTVSMQSAWKEEHEEVDPRGGYVELYADGRVFVATPITRRSSRSDGEGAIGNLTLADDSIMLTDLCVSWASHQAGAWGVADLVIGIAHRGETTGLFKPPLTLHYVVHNELRRVPDTRPVREPVQAVTTADLAAGGDQLGRLQVAHDVLTVLLHHFGIAETVHLEQDGTVVSWAWTGREDDVEKWARGRNLPHHPRYRR